MYIGTTKRSMATRIKEHQRNCRLGQTEKSAVAEHAISQGNHRIIPGEMKLLVTSSGYYSRLVRLVIKIHKHTDNFNTKDENPKLNKIWNTMLKNAEIPITRYKYNLRPGVCQSATRIGNAKG